MLHSRVLTQDLGILIFTHRVNSCNLLIASTASTYSPRQQPELTLLSNNFNLLSASTAQLTHRVNNFNLLTASTAAAYSPDNNFILLTESTASAYSSSPEIQLTDLIKGFCLRRHLSLLSFLSC